MIFFKVSVMSEDNLRAKLGVVCTARQLIMGEAWVQKVLQLKQVGSCESHVHPRGTRKSKGMRRIDTSTSTTTSTRACAVQNPASEQAGIHAVRYAAIHTFDNRIDEFTAVRIYG